MPYEYLFTCSETKNGFRVYLAILRDDEDYHVQIDVCDGDIHNHIILTIDEFNKFIDKSSVINNSGTENNFGQCFWIDSGGERSIHITHTRENFRMELWSDGKLVEHLASETKNLEIIFHLNDKHKINQIIKEQIESDEYQKMYEMEFFTFGNLDFLT